MKRYNKLVRDKIPELVVAKGVDVKTHIASGEEYFEKLLEKLQEEVNEFRKEKNLEELVDIEEVIRALAAYFGTSPEVLEALRQKKFEERGGFEKRIILDETDSKTA